MITEKKPKKEKEGLPSGNVLLIIISFIVTIIGLFKNDIYLTIGGAGLLILFIITSA